MSEAYRGISSSLRWATSRSRQIDSIARCAFSMIVPPDAVLAAEAVQFREDPCRAQLFPVHRDDVASAVVQLGVLAAPGSLFGRHGPAPHVLLGLARGVLEDAALVRNVEQIRVHRVGRSALLPALDRDAVLLRVFEQLFPGAE